MRMVTRLVHVRGRCYNVSSGSGTLKPSRAADLVGCELLRDEPGTGRMMTLEAFDGERGFERHYEIQGDQQTQWKWPDNAHALCSHIQTKSESRPKEGDRMAIEKEYQKHISRLPQIPLICRGGYL
ncbi:putative major histocompatibility complex class I-related gene protein-like protein [Triplophysa rosa]|uniref:Major histocompatibility complex class I-related gene protein-like protein n=1 Tax=Triplophysa rosa TaxID=992332 RepID=A0A9W7TWX7_TRIRA|nr:putative major histocompatibility complex class I-related gene protein-like protein [Triplophysa rosa]